MSALTSKMSGMGSQQGQAGKSSFLEKAKAYGKECWEKAFWWCR